MPRYLALQYLESIVKSRRYLLSCHLLAIPSHLDSAQFYAHCGMKDFSAGDSSMEPWKTVHAISAELSMEGLIEDMCSLQELIGKPPETETYEYVAEYDDSGLSSLRATDCCSSPVAYEGHGQMEVPLAEDCILRDIAPLPLVSRLLCCLAMEVVPDPFNCDSSSFLGSEVMARSDVGHNSGPIVQREKFHVVSIDDDEMEEAIADGMLTETADLLRSAWANDLSSLRAEYGTILDDYCDVSSEIRALTSSLEISVHEEVMIADLVAPVAAVADWRSIDDCLKKPLLKLETPVVPASSRSDNDWFESPWTVLLYVEVEYDTDDFAHLVRKSSDLCGCTKPEKYTNEWDSYVVAEPTVECSSDELERSLHPRVVADQLGLSNDVNVVDIELQLPWDPLCSSLSCAIAFKRGDLVWNVDEAEACDEQISGAYSVETIGWYSSPSPMIGSCGDEEVHAATFAARTSDNATSCTYEFSGTSNAAATGPSRLDPFERFLALRNKSAAVACREPAKKSGTSNRPEPSADVVLKADEGTKKSSREFRVVTVVLSDAYQHVVELLESYARPAITYLTEQRVIPAVCTLLELTVERAHFFFKQQIYQITDDSSGCGINLVHQATLVYLLANVADQVFNVGLQFALLQLASLYEKCCKFLCNSDTIEEIRQRLFNIHCQYLQSRTFHPKVVYLCNIIAQRLTSTSSTDIRQTVLIVFQKSISSLAEHLRECLTSIPGVSVRIVTVTMADDQWKLVFSRHNCIISFHNTLSSAQQADFDLIVDYDYRRCMSEQQQESVANDGASAVQDRITLKTVQKTSSHYQSSADAVSCMVSDLEQVLMVVSRAVTNNVCLMCLLETQYNLLLVDRDYDSMQTTPPQAANQDADVTTDRYYEDVIVDLSTCIVLQDLAQFSDKNCAQGLLKKVAALSLKFVTCYVILNQQTRLDGNVNERDVLTADVVRNCAKLQAALSVVDENIADYSIKVIVCLNIEETAAVIRRIARSSRVGRIDRSWISRDPSQVECILMTYPCLHSVSAQLLMYSTSSSPCTLASLLTMSYEQLCDRYPQLPRKVLKMFVEVNRAGHRLGQQLTASDLDSGRLDLNLTRSSFADTEFVRARSGRDRDFESLSPSLRAVDCRAAAAGSSQPSLIPGRQSSSVGQRCRVYRCDDDVRCEEELAAPSTAVDCGMFNDKALFRSILPPVSCREEFGHPSNADSRACSARYIPGVVSCEESCPQTSNSYRRFVDLPATFADTNAVLKSGFIPDFAAGVEWRPFSRSDADLPRSDCPLFDIGESHKTSYNGLGQQQKRAWQEIEAELVGGQVATAAGRVVSPAGDFARRWPCDRTNVSRGGGSDIRRRSALVTAHAPWSSSQLMQNISNSNRTQCQRDCFNYQLFDGSTPAHFLDSVNEQHSRTHRDMTGVQASNIMTPFLSDNENVAPDVNLTQEAINAQLAVTSVPSRAVLRQHSGGHLFVTTGSNQSSSNSSSSRASSAAVARKRIAGDWSKENALVSSWGDGENFENIGAVLNESSANVPSASASFSCRPAGTTNYAQQEILRSRKPEVACVMPQMRPSMTAREIWNLDSVKEIPPASGLTPAKVAKLTANSESRPYELYQPIRPTNNSSCHWSVAAPLHRQLFTEIGRSWNKCDPRTSFWPRPPDELTAADASQANEENCERRGADVGRRRGYDRDDVQGIRSDYTERSNAKAQADSFSSAFGSSTGEIFETGAAGYRDETAAGNWFVRVVDSPPVDLDSDEAQLQFVHRTRSPDLCDKAPVPAKKKLAIEKNCSLAGGQTRLKFV